MTDIQPIMLLRAGVFTRQLSSEHRWMGTKTGGK